MSFQMMTWAVRQTTGSSTEKAVLLALANRASHETGVCYPKVETIAKETEFKATAVKTALSSLVKKGFITRKRRRRADGSLGTYEYRFNNDLVLLPPESSPDLPEAADDSRPGTANDSQDLVLKPSNQTPSAAPSKERPRNVVWDALVAAYGDPLESERSEFGKTASELREWFINTGGSPETEWAAVIAARVAEQDEGWRTHRLLRTRWSELGSKVEDGESGYKQAVCTECEDSPAGRGFWFEGGEKIPCPFCDGSL